MPEFKLSKTGKEFVDDDSFVRAIMGPIGSGKSALCVNELMRLALMQEPSSYDGRRRSRWAIIRNTYGELRDTTINTFFDWIPKGIGKWLASEAKFNIRSRDLDIEFIFRALDRPDDIKKLLSLELTGAFVNEAREVPLEVIEMLIGRLGRYPRQSEGGPTRYSLIMDTNPPDEDHWWYRLFEEVRPPEWKLHRQPSARSPDAENLANLPEDYYVRLAYGKDQEWIKVYVDGQYGNIQDGKPIFPEYNDQLHTASEVIATTDHDLIIGIDFGLTPAGVVVQRRADGGYDAIEEIVTQDMGALQFANVLGPKIRANYRYPSKEFWGDPAGDQRSQADSRESAFSVLRAQGIPAQPAPTNDPMLRREAVARLLTTLSPAGVPMLRISPKCRMLRKGLMGGYKYRRIQVSYDERYEEKPYKNLYSHVCEALEYAICGSGEALDLIRSGYNDEVNYAELYRTAI